LPLLLKKVEFNYKMGVIKRIVKPRNQKSKRALEAREPKAIENAKSAIFIRGPKSSDMVMTALRDLHALKKPNVAPSFYGKSKILLYELTAGLRNWREGGRVQI
jgi:ribosome production factor 2